jgi:hypothetical protein
MPLLCMLRAPNKRWPLQALGKTAAKGQRARMLEGTRAIMWALDHKRGVNAVDITIFKCGEMEGKNEAERKINKKSMQGKSATYRCDDM